MKEVMMCAQKLAEAILNSDVYQHMHTLEEQVTQDEAAKLKTLAKEGVTSRPKIIDLTRSLKQEKQASAFWKSRYDELREQTKDYIAAVKHSPEAVKNFLQEIMQKQMQEFNRRARERKNNREER